MGSPESKRDFLNSIAMYINMAGVIFIYGVILIFCIRQLVESDVNTSEEWLNAIVDAICISTFTYTFTQMLNNIFIQNSQKFLKLNISILLADVIYILLYGVFKQRPGFLNIILCIYSMVLIVSASLSLHLAIKGQGDGQACNEHGAIDDYPKGRLPE